MNQKTDTLTRIQTAAIKEFQEKGFRAASLRQIVKQAGVTTGAFYGYFSSKEALFASIVEPHAAAVMEKYVTAHIQFADSSKESQLHHMSREADACIDWMIDYMYEHLDAFKLLICCSEGTSYEHFVNTMAEIEVDYTYRYMDVLRSLGYPIPEVDKDLCHMIASGMFEGIFEVLRHDMTRDRAKIFVSQLRTFYSAGWATILEQ